MSEDKRGVGAVSINSLSKKITSRLAVIVAVMFLLIVSISGMISMISLEAVTKDKLETLAYENVFLIKNGIENSYGQALGFANSLRNISALPPEEQRDAIDHALKGFLLGDENFTTVFAYFEQNAIADANGEPLEGVNKIAKTIENKGFSRKGKADGKNFVRWKPLHILERCKEKRQGKAAVRHGLGIVFKL